MSGGGYPTKAERLQGFFHRLAKAPAAGSFDEAYRLLCETLNAVEDELSGTPFNPEAWMLDGRMYPPQLDSERVASGRSDVRRFRSRFHSILIGENGAIAIHGASGAVAFSKPGRDGLEI